MNTANQMIKEFANEILVKSNEMEEEDIAGEEQELGDEEEDNEDEPDDEDIDEEIDEEDEEGETGLDANIGELLNNSLGYGDL